MNQNEQGMVYAFCLSGSRMRQSAVNLRRHGQVLDALALVRRAAEQEDTSAAWLALAQELRHTCNWETAAQLLARVLSREPDHPSAWVDMARCLHALGQADAALDCAYHQLRVDPWSPEGDAARRLIGQMQPPEREHEIRREQRLIHRALSAWQGGDRPLGERRVRRALRIVQEKERLLVTAAMLCMMQLDLDGALRYLTRALRANSKDPRTLTALATLYYQRGKPRMARGFLRLAGEYADSVLAEDGFLTAAWAQDAWDEMKDYLAARRKRMPYRTALQSAEAGMLTELGEPARAREIWRDIVAVNPDDRYAASMLTTEIAPAERILNVPGMLRRSVRLRQMEELKTAAAKGENLLCCGSRNRQLLDWCLTSSDAAERQCAMGLLEERDGEIVAAYLKELLCRPFLRPETRQWALHRLAEMDCGERVLILLGGHYSIIGCRKAEDGDVQTPPWRTFLPTLLNVTRHHRRSNEIAEFAADVWLELPQALREQAAGRACYTWCIAMEALFLRAAGEEDQAVRTVMDAYVPVRRISRVIRQISRCVLQDNVQMELENGDT
nr:tetratricopeptide repeat protein [Clostridia bacterium]